jgi:hypothetical protein
MIRRFRFDGSTRAPVAESVDAADSKSVAREGVLVQVRPGAPRFALKASRMARPALKIRVGVELCAPV